MANTHIPDPAQAGVPSSALKSARPRLALFVGAIAVGVSVAAALFTRFPNLRSSPEHLALVLLTPLFCGLTIGFLVSRLGRVLPHLATPLLYGLTALVLLLDVVVYVGPLVVRGPTGTDSAPAFVNTSQATRAPNTDTPTAAPAPATRQGAFDHRPGVDTVAGTAILGVASDGTLLLRFDHLQAANGPDLYVYLSRIASPTTSQQVMDGLEVGTLRATTGSTNYRLPSGTDLSQFKSVVIYCKSFSVVFGFANLA